MQVTVPPRWITLWLPLRGEIEMLAEDRRWLLRQGTLMVWREDALHASIRRAGWWLAACGSPAAWARHLRPRPGEQAMEIFPWDGACPTELRRSLVHLARVAADDAPRGDAGAATDMLGAALYEHQRGLLSLLERCSGRTRQRKQQTLLRMLRVRHAIDCSLDTRLDLESLALTANYSPCHLIRVFRTIFGETPFEYGSRLRAERAWQLVRDTRMPVCEITEALGFESQSAFCRAFKNAYGMTTSEARLRINDDTPASRAA